MRGELFWVDRWRSSSAYGLSMEARGLYRELLSLAWISGGKLPTSDPAKLRRMVGADADEWERSWPMVEPYWQPDASGSLENKVQAEIYSESLRRSASHAERGRLGAAKRWPSHGAANSPAIAQPSDSHPVATAQVMPSVSGSGSVSVSVSRDTHARARDDVLVMDLITAWDTTCPFSRTSAVPPKSLLAQCRAALARDGLLVWEERFRVVAASPFLSGRNDRGWCATLFWTLGPKNAAKIDGGCYSQRQMTISTRLTAADLLADVQEGA